MFLGLAFIGGAVALSRAWPKRCRFTKAHAMRAASALKIDFDRQRFDVHDLMVGMNVEREHADITHCDPVLSARIARAHLLERPDYYQRLKRYVE